MRRISATLVLLVALTALAIAAPAGAAGTGGMQYGAATKASEPAPGGVDPSQPLPPLPPEPAPPTPEPIAGQVATVGEDGLAIAPAGAPEVVQAIIAAGNRIAKTRYLWGGGHRRWEDKGYDCSGSVSYALKGAGLLESPLVSGEFMRWGDAGPGAWVTIYANRGHMYMVVAGLRFDTSGQRRAGTRWQAAMRSGKGFRLRHPAGL